MKKILYSIVTLCLVFAVIFSMAGCNTQKTTENPTATPEAQTQDEFNVKNTDARYLVKEATCSTRACYYYSNEAGEKGDKVFYAGETLEHTMVDGVCSVCHYTDGAPQISGDKAIFGEYPKTEVTDETLCSALLSLAGELPEYRKDGNWTSFEYYRENYNFKAFSWFIDIEYEGEKYRGIYFTMFRPRKTSVGQANSFQKRAGFELNTPYWFKYEPITWTIISQTDDTALILSDYILDATHYYPAREERTDADGNIIYASNYEHSAIREWLNATFLNTAFTELQASEYILDTLVDNSNDSANPTTRLDKFNNGVNPFVCNDTVDKVFLLSYKEVTSAEYGFAAWDVHDDARKKKATQYALSQGMPMLMEAIRGTSLYGNYESVWWLRTPDYEDGNCVRTVYEYGFAYHFQSVEYTKYGVLPAMTIKTQY